MSNPRRLRVCAVCGHGLNIIGPPGEEVGYVHSPGHGDDHVAVPVEPGDVPMRPVCDMCNTVTHPNEVYTWPCRDFVMANGSANEGDWCLCPGCHVLAVNERWEELTQLVIDQLAAKHGERNRPAIEGHVRAFHEAFREHRDGDPYRGVPVEYLNAHQ